MKKVILLTVFLALVVSLSGYAISEGFRSGDGTTGFWGNHGGYGMMGSGGSGMMGMHGIGAQGQMPNNPATGQPYTEEEWNLLAEQMHNTCSAFMGVNPGTKL